MFNFFLAAPELLEAFIDSFDDEEPDVQLQLLTAVVKLFLKRPDDSKDMVTEVLKLATEHINNADLRDRGYIYWRLLSTDPDAAQAIVLSKKPTIADLGTLSQSFLNSLTPHIGTLASVHHRPPSHFIKGAKAEGLSLKSHTVGADDSSSDSGSDSSESESSDEEETHSKKGKKKKGSPAKKGEADKTPTAPQNTSQSSGVDLLNMDLFSMGGTASPAPAQPSGGASGLDDLFAPSSSVSSAKPASPAPKIVLTSASGKGLQIAVTYARVNSGTFEKHVSLYFCVHCLLVNHGLL